jgi:hypothetical protein
MTDRNFSTPVQPSASVESMTSFCRPALSTTSLFSLAVAVCFKIATHSLSLRPAGLHKTKSPFSTSHPTCLARDLTKPEPRTFPTLHPALLSVFVSQPSTLRRGQVDDALQEHGDWTIEIVKRSDTAKGFILLPRRWVVERTFAWLNRNRRLAKDVERTIESAVTWLYVASVKLMSRRLAMP